MFNFKNLKNKLFSSHQIHDYLNAAVSEEDYAERMENVERNRWKKQFHTNVFFKF